MSAEELRKRLEEIGLPDYTGPVYTQVGVRTSRITHVLLAGTPGDAILDEQWPAELGGVDPDGKAYPSLMSAIRFAISKGIVWERVRNEGQIKCLLPCERVKAAEARVKSSRRRARAAIKVLDATDRDELSSDERAQANTLYLVSVVVERATKPMTVKKLVARESEKDRMQFLAGYIIEKA